MKFIKFFIVLSLLSFLNGCKNQSRKPESKFEIINGCKKQISEKLFDRNGKDSLEWIKSYNKSSKETCDFTAYIIKNKKFINGNLIEKTQFISGCDECEEKPCGIWIYYDKNGTKFKERDFGECSLEKLDK